MENNEKRNEKFLNEFASWLEEKNLSPKTIRNHVSNADLYLNNYLVYYEDEPMESGCSIKVDDFLGDWFIRKCMWSTAYSVKTTAASLKKFYQCMTERNHVEKKDYKILCDIIKDNMEYWINAVNRYNDFDEEDWF